MPWAALAILGGTALSAGGGLMQGQAEGRAGRQARDYAGVRYANQQSQYNRGLYGHEDTLNILRGMDPGLRERYIGERFGVVDDPSWPGGGLSGNSPEELYQRLLDMGKIDPNARDSNAVIPGMQRLAENTGRRQQGLMSAYDRNTGELARLAGGAESMARRYGRGAESLIDEQSAVDLERANKQAQARLNASGLGGSTLVANQMGQNAQEFSRGARQQKLGARRETLDRVLQARSERIGTLGQRYGGRTALGSSFLDRDVSLRQAPLNVRLSALASPVANPYTNQTFSQYYPGASGGANALGSAGGTLSLLGGYGLSGGFGGGGQGGSTYGGRGTWGMR